MKAVVSSVTLFVLVLSSAAKAEGPHPFRDGEFSGGARTYFMATQNRETLQDWYSLAVGGRLGYHTAPLAGFGAGVKAYAARALFGNSDVIDTTTGRPSRYELGLYDVENPRSREVALVGEAYVDFRSEEHLLWFGRHELATPLFNPQDGRMIPTLAQGVWYSGNVASVLGLQAGYLSHVAPRGAAGFRRVADSFGMYPVGRNVDGTPSGYAGNVESNGLFVASASYGGESFKLNVWDFFNENVFNAIYSDAYLEPHFADLAWRFGVQHILEHKLHDGGNPDQSLAYFQDERAQAFGAQVRAETQSKWSLSANYDRITSEGRFVFPREWGKEPLFVFQKRERSEGSGDLHAWLLQLGKVWNFEQRGKLRSLLGYGHYHRPEPTEPDLNKYALPSLFQANLDTFYHFGGELSGLVAELLVVYKGELGSVAQDNPNFLLNKVDMLNWNFVVNYEF